MELSIVVAMASNGVIGRNGDLPWRLPADLQEFKAITMGKPIIMGRLTHESIGRPLPGRENIVLSHDPDYRAQGCRIINNLKELDDIVKDDEAMIIGGARLYADVLPVARRLYITEVHADVEGDVSFPEFDRTAWTESRRQRYQADAKNEYDYSFVLLERKPS